MASFIHAIGTAVPNQSIDQQTIANFMSEALQMDETESRKLRALYRQTMISKRHSVISDYSKSIEDFQFFPKNKYLEPFPTVSDRMLEYRKNALPLAIEAVKNCFKNYESELDKKSITHLITVSCTGMYAPGLDIDLVEKMGLSSNVERTCINFMGCYGAFNALKLADSICGNDADASVLIVSVELCTIHFQKEKTENNLLSNALFSDGAASVFISPKPIKVNTSLLLKSFYCDLFSEGKSDMEWNIANHGFEMVLSSNVPKIVKAGIGNIFDKLLKKSNLKREDIHYYAMHPGGRAILEAIESALELTKNENTFAYQILENYGNMSSATVLFVLQNLLNNIDAGQKNKNILSCAFGPGLTLESMILEIY
jgi:alpha-pyrone synthase